MRRIYTSRPGVAMTAFALLIGIPATVASIVAVGSTWERVSLIAVCAGITATFAALPAIGAVRFRRLIIQGIRAPGEILTVRWHAAGIRPETIDAADNGMARGTRRVFHPSGVFDETFESDAPWASTLGVGTAIDLLIDPSRLKVWLDLGPSSRLGRRSGNKNMHGLLLGGDTPSGDQSAE